jgi:hypothetical protein
MSELSWTVDLGLSAVVISVREDSVLVLTVEGQPAALPFGSFDPEIHRTLELAVRSWVDEQTGLSLGYVEQLYTFGNRHRDPERLENKRRLVTVGYLALVGPEALSQNRSGKWRDWYTFLPWEDHRNGRPELLDQIILPQLDYWAKQGEGTERVSREQRVCMAFGNGKTPWDPEKVLPRFELLYEAGLVSESQRDWNSYPEEERYQLPITQKRMNDPELIDQANVLGEPLNGDQRRILASTMGRLRAKIRYRPVVFELVSSTFTLLKLQRVVEALSGVVLHKQNFRRLLLQGGLVKEADGKDWSQPGRPAQFYRFRHSVLLERPTTGIGLPQRRG